MWSPLIELPLRVQSGPPKLNSHASKKLIPHVSSWLKPTIEINSEETSRDRVNLTCWCDSPYQKTSVPARNFSLPVAISGRDGFKIQFPVWADTTKSSEIKFQGESLEKFQGSDHVKRAVHADLGVIGWNQPAWSVTVKKLWRYISNWNQLVLSKLVLSSLTQSLLQHASLRKDSFFSFW